MTIDYLTILPATCDKSTAEIYDRIMTHLNDKIQSGEYKNQRHNRRYIDRVVIDGKDVVRAHGLDIFPKFIADVPSEMIVKIAKARRETDQSFKLDYDGASGWFTYEL